MNGEKKWGTTKMSKKGGRQGSSRRTSWEELRVCHNKCPVDRSRRRSRESRQQPGTTKACESTWQMRV
eukprot:983326-Rhodomonas_salina.1